VIKIALDTSALQADFKAHAMRGTGRYVKELFEFFENLSGQTEVKICELDRGKGPFFSLANRLLKYVPTGQLTIGQQCLFPLELALNAGKYDYVHFPAHIDAPAWGLRKYAVTVLDLIPLVLSDMYRPEHAGWRFNLARWLYNQSIKNASLILAISENTARDVHEHLGVPMEKIVVTPLGVDESFFEVGLNNGAEKYKEDFNIAPERPVVLYVGGIDQRKNIQGLIGSFARLIEVMREKGESIPVLLMAGDIQRDKQYPLLKQLIEENKIEEEVVMPGYVDDQALKNCYAFSSLFFFPSLYEGFGLPPLEAMAAGLPVVSSGCSSLPEVLGDSAVIVNPEDIEECSSAMYRVLGDENFARELSEKGRVQARKFTWQRTGELTLEAYEKLEKKQD